ncbi:hypothetical protein BDW71DRAFT_200377 [Aspergillus fruticulosus]
MADILDMPLCLCYPVADRASHPNMICTLQKGLERLSSGFPWVAGQVVNEGASGENTGIYKIKPYPNMALKKASFPIEMIDESILAPRRTIPGFLDEAAIKHTPVFLIQATVINRGTPAHHYQPACCNGHDRTRSTHEPPLQGVCHGVPITDEELLVRNINCLTLIPLLGNTYEPKPQPTDTDRSSHAGPCTWAHFTSRPASLVAPSRAPVCSVSPLTESTLAHTINLHRYMDTIPNTYPGLVQNMLISKSTLNAVNTSTLGTISAALRSALAADSGTRVSCYKLDFGLRLGSPEAAADGEIGAAVCLKDEDMARLRADEVFGKYAVLVGQVVFC